MNPGAADRVVMVGAEVTPFAKVGGLADVLGALPGALARLGLTVDVVAPRCPALEPEGLDLRRSERTPSLEVPGPWGAREVEVWEGPLGDSGARVHLLRHAPFFDRTGLYVDPATGEGYGDNATRFCFFSRAAYAWLRSRERAPAVVHLHDQHPAALAIYLRGGGPAAAPRRPGLVFTIHNIAFQGTMETREAEALGFPADSLKTGGLLEYFGRANFMKAALLLADRITTVSPNYAREIQSSAEYGQGLESLLAWRSRDLVGILNGVDYRRWDPARDEHLPAKYDASDLEGKRASREALCRAMWVDGGEAGRTPILGLVSRLTSQKGFDLLAEAADSLLARDLRLVVLGTGEHRYHDLVERLVRKYPGRFGVYVGFNEPLAHLVEAGSDMFLMPSRYEPCGLNQMYSLRYGTVPVVRETGGLADTVVDADRHPDEGTGFVFRDYDASSLLEAVDRARRAFAEPARWRSIMTRGMSQDFGWDRAARAYRDLYREIAPG